MDNKLIIAAAGSGKTTFLIKEAIKLQDGPILITTFTEANEQEIIKKFIKICGCVPKNVVIQTWFSFLLQHGVKPYQGVITEKDIKGLLLVNSQSAVKYYTKTKIPICFSEQDDVEKHYFDSLCRIYSDKIAKFTCRCNEKTKGLITNRIQRIFKYVFIDEVQDLAGYDLELVKLFLQSTSSVLMVGDPRQVTYHTHDERKYSGYKDGEIERFILEQCKCIQCEIDNTTLSKTYRNNPVICNFANKIFPQFPCCTSEQKEVTKHDGIFLVKRKDVGKYLEEYSPMQLRDKINVLVDNRFPAMNFGNSKGLTFQRVLIYPTGPMIDWIKNNQADLAPQSRSKFYVAVTRAKYSVAFVYDYNDKTDYAGIVNYQYCQQSL